ncbi:MAG: hypothetical protein ACOCQD_04255 [archaeon]
MKGILVILIILLFTSCGDSPEFVIRNSSNYDLVLEFEDESCDSVKYLAYLIRQASGSSVELDSLTQILSDSTNYVKYLEQIKENIKLNSLYSDQLNIMVLNTSGTNIFNPNQKIKHYYNDTLAVVDEVLKNRKFIIFLPSGDIFKSSGSKYQKEFPILSSFPNYQKMNIYYKNSYIGSLSPLLLKEFEKEKSSENWQRGSRLLDIEDHEVMWMKWK